MIVTHTFKIQAICPVNGDTDYYECEVQLDCIVEVEQLIADAAGYAKKEIFQEELTNKLAEQWKATVRTRGHHVGGQVATECISMPASRVTVNTTGKVPG